jgi:uncharacterized protein YcfL
MRKMIFSLIFTCMAGMAVCGCGSTKNEAPKNDSDSVSVDSDSVQADSAVITDSAAVDVAK